MMFVDLTFLPMLEKYIGAYKWCTANIGRKYTQ